MNASVTTRVGLGLLAAALFVVGRAQAQTAIMAVPANYAVGPGDVLNVLVLNDTDLNENVTVDANGMIPLPVSRRNLAVAGKTTLEIAQLVEQGLVADQQEKTPRVNVNVAAVESKPVSVSGAVRTPGVWQAALPFSLLEAINRAGGTSDSGAMIQIRQLQPDGSEKVVYTTTMPKLLNAISGNDDPMLHGGEQISVLTGGKIYVGGEVGRPGTIPVDTSEQITVLKAYALAGQQTKVAALDKAVIYHNSGAGGLDPKAAQPVNLKLILQHKAPDVVLQADDFLYIPRSGGKAFTQALLQGTQSALTVAAGTTLTGIP